VALHRRSAASPSRCSARQPRPILFRPTLLGGRAAACNVTFHHQSPTTIRQDHRSAERCSDARAGAGHLRRGGRFSPIIKPVSSRTSRNCRGLCSASPAVGWRSSSGGYFDRPRPVGRAIAALGLAAALAALVCARPWPADTRAALAYASGGPSGAPPPCGRSSLDRVGAGCETRRRG